jgi:hypothetical protein
MEIDMMPKSDIFALRTDAMASGKQMFRSTNSGVKEESNQGLNRMPQLAHDGIVVTVYTENENEFD